MELFLVLVPSIRKSPSPLIPIGFSIAKTGVPRKFSAYDTWEQCNAYNKTYFLQACRFNLSLQNKAFHVNYDLYLHVDL